MLARFMKFVVNDVRYIILLMICNKNNFPSPLPYIRYICRRLVYLCNYTVYSTDTVHKYMLYCTVAENWSSLLG